MEKIDQFGFYRLGQLLTECAQWKPEQTAPIVAVMPAVQAVSSLKELLEGKPIPLGLSKAATSELLAALELVVSECLYRDVDGKKEYRWPEGREPPLDKFSVFRAQQALRKFETVLSEELREEATYYVPRRGIFFTPALVDAADESFPAEVRGIIPEKTRMDWRAAGRCLAFNLLTASGFHVARAVEGTMEAYYQGFSGKLGATLKSWNDYIQELEKITRAGAMPAPSDKVLTELRQMKDEARNPLMHPRVVLTEGDARMLFANGESVIIAMAQELLAARAGVQPLLELAAAPMGGS